jgi:hypothetical protein
MEEARQFALENPFLIAVRAKALVAISVSVAGPTP